MWNDFKRRLWAYTSLISSFVKQNAKKFSIAGLLALVGLLQVFGVWTPIISWAGKNLPIWGTSLISSWTAPIFVWLIIFFLFLTLIYYVLKDHWYLGKVAGEFYDDLKTGLSNWDYKGDWRIEEEDSKRVLSVANSPIGGFTKKGFNWTDYEFSFETKVIKVASGWVIRANASDYFMVQLYLEGNADYNYKLRPHYHKLELGTEIWLPDDNNSVNLSTIALEKEIKLLQWVKVKIIVESNQVDIYLDGKHALHYLISSVGVSISKKFTLKNTSGKEFEATTNEIVPLGINAAGRVGFRSGDGEHAHFRNIKVKPL